MSIVPWRWHTTEYVIHWPLRTQNLRIRENHITTALSTSSNIDINEEKWICTRRLQRYSTGIRQDWLWQRELTRNLRQLNDKASSTESKTRKHHMLLATYSSKLLMIEPEVLLEARYRTSTAQKILSVFTGPPFYALVDNFILAKSVQKKVKKSFRYRKLQTT